MSQSFWFDPALPFVEVRRAQRSRACYRPHTHPTFSIGVVDAGYSTFCYENSEPIRLTAGDVVVVQPRQVHSCNPDPDSTWCYQMLHLEERWVLNLLAEIGSYSPETKIHLPARIRDTECYLSVTALTDSLFTPGDVRHKESLLIEFIGRIFAGSSYVPETKKPEWLFATQELLSKQFAKEWSIEALAGSVGLSRYHFIRVFREHTGITPHAYLLDCRINHARQLLRLGCSLVEIAQSLGFADQSHFHHAFKQRVAVTPRQYLARQRT